LYLQLSTAEGGATQMGSEIIIVPFIFATLGFVVWVAFNGWQRRSQVKLLTEFNSRLLERIGSVRDFSEFLQTEGGAKFMDRVTAGGTPPDIRMAILRSVQTGLVLFALGVGLLVLARIFRGGFPVEHPEVFTITGVIALSLGIGFFLSGGAAYRLASAMQRRSDG
jgi:hypothetical protein